MTGKEQARLLGLLFWVFTGFQLLIVALVGVIYLFVAGAIMVGNPSPGRNDPPPEFIAGILVVVMVVILAMTLLFSVPKLVAGYGLRKEKPWARGWSIAACCMATMSFPLGTALGVWGLIFLLGEQGKQYFDSIEYGRLNMQAPQMIPPPPPNSWQ